MRLDVDSFSAVKFTTGHRIAQATILLQTNQRNPQPVKKTDDSAATTRNTSKYAPFTLCRRKRIQHDGACELPALGHMTIDNLPVGFILIRPVDLAAEL